MTFRKYVSPVSAPLMHANLYQLLDVSPLDQRLKRILVIAIVRLSHESNLYPECLVMRGIQKQGKYKHPVAVGAGGDVWKGIVRGETVAIKVLRVHRDEDTDLTIEEIMKVWLTLLQQTGLIRQPL
jgi:hypothetical protein